MATSGRWMTANGRRIAVSRHLSAVSRHLSAASRHSPAGSRHLITALTNALCSSHLPLTAANERFMDLQDSVNTSDWPVHGLAKSRTKGCLREPHVAKLAPFSSTVPTLLPRVVIA